MSRRRFIWQEAETQSGLPEGYTAVDYLQSTGTQWIEMDVAPNQNTKAVLKIKINVFTDTGASLIGSRTDVNSDDQFTTYLDGYDGTRFLFRMDARPEAISWKGLTTDKIYIVTLSGTEMKAELEDGTAVFSKTFSVSDFTSTVTMALFRAKGVGGTYFQGRIYGCKHYSGDELIQDFVPCLNADGVPCMFDLVSRKSFYNKGNGSFTWG